MDSIPYLKLQPWDVQRWRRSSAAIRMGLAEQGAYLNLCFSAWERQPGCQLPADDRELWRLANARGLDDWQAVRAGVFNCDAWVLTGGGLWLNEVVLETYAESRELHLRAVRSGRIAGRASAAARRAASQVVASSGTSNGRSTAVQRPFNDRSTAVNPLSLSLSLSNGQRTNDNISGSAADDSALDLLESPGNGTGEAKEHRTKDAYYRAIRPHCEHILDRRLNRVEAAKVEAWRTAGIPVRHVLAALEELPEKPIRTMTYLDLVVRQHSERAWAALRR